MDHLLLWRQSKSCTLMGWLTTHKAADSYGRARSSTGLTLCLLYYILNVKKLKKTSYCFVNFFASSSPYNPVRLVQKLLVFLHYEIFLSFFGFALLDFNVFLC